MALPEIPDPERESVRSQQQVQEAALLECTALFVLALLLQGLSPVPSAGLRLYANLLIALAPALLWLGNSWLRSSGRPQLRANALACMIISGLVCRAVCLPLIEQVYEVQRWLALESAVNRIIGYSLTAGLTQTMALWCVVRYAVPRYTLGNRFDLLPCCRAAAAGYATVAGLHHALSTGPTAVAQAFATFNITVALNCVAIILAYALAELYFRRNLFLLLPLALSALAAMVAGSAIPLVAGFSNAGISSLQAVASESPLSGSVYSLGLLLATWAVFRFLFANAGSDTVR